MILSYFLVFVTKNVTIWIDLLTHFCINLTFIIFFRNVLIMCAPLKNPTSGNLKSFWSKLIEFKELAKQNLILPFFTLHTIEAAMGTCYARWLIQAHYIDTKCKPSWQFCPLGPNSPPAGKKKQFADNNQCPGSISQNTLKLT